MNATLRTGGLAVLAVAIWFICRYANEPHSVRGIETPATEFSAVRAANTLERILSAERPHPAGSEENARVRARILVEFDRLGISAKPYRAMGCNYGARYGAVECAMVTDIIAEVKKGKGKAIVLLAHYDSVPAGPGAADDGSGVASILETVRALKARGFPGKHPILALITDGEEYGLLGAAAFLHDPKLKARVGAVVNVEARGNRGPSLLFQTSPGNGPLIDLYAKSSRRYFTSSLFSEIYKRLPNDTDLTLFLREDFPAVNFAFSENVAQYHTPLDTATNLSRATLQNQGENLLDMVTGLGQTDFAALRGSEAVYLSILGVVLPRMPQWLALPLAVLLFVAIAFASYIARERKMRWDQQFLSFSMPLLLVGGCVLAGWGLFAVARLVSGMPDPTFAYPVTFRIALSFAIAAVTLAVSAIAPAHGLARGAWLWLAGLGAVSAVFLPGISPYFLVPCLVSAIVLLLAARSRMRWLGRFGQICLLLAATLNLIIWFSLVVSGETVMGLSLHYLFTVPAALGLVAIVPLLGAEPLQRRTRRFIAVICILIALVASVAAGLIPAYSDMAPQRLNLNYVEDHVRGRALWSADTSGPLPSSLASAAKFSKAPETIFPDLRLKTYVAPAGKPQFPSPTAEIRFASEKRVTLTLQGSERVDQMFLMVPAEADLKTVWIGDWRLPITAHKANSRGTLIICLTRDCHNRSIALDVASPQSFDLVLGERRFGLPPDGARLLMARPKTAVPSQSGDGILLLSKFEVRR